VREIRIVTDSTADIPRDIREELGIEMVPLKVMFGSEAFTDGVTIESDQFYEKLASSSELPTTSQPSPNEFIETYERILNEDPETQIISFHLAAAVSGTYQSALLATSLLEGEYDITVIDTKSASYGFGLMVVKAAEMARAGRSKQAILAEVERLRLDRKLYFLVDTLEYLQKGGRIGKAAALFGSILNIKPILSLEEDGTVGAVDKVRGQKKAMLRIADLLQDEFQGDPVHIAIAWSWNNAPAMDLCELIKSRFNVQSVQFTKLGAVIGTHVGPGTAAVFMYRV
jgi:DegV family protein with EDD domain